MAQWWNNKIQYKLIQKNYELTNRLDNTIEKVVIKGVSFHFLILKSRFNCVFLLFFSGGFYSDTLAYVSKTCKRCPNGSFVEFEKTPGKQQRDCISCPLGKVAYVYVS